MWVRAVLALLGWLLACLLQSAPAFGVPPVLVEEAGEGGDFQPW